MDMSLHRVDLRVVRPFLCVFCRNVLSDPVVLKCAHPCCRACATLWANHPRCMLFADNCPSGDAATALTKFVLCPDCEKQTLEEDFRSDALLNDALKAFVEKYDVVPGTPLNSVFAFESERLPLDGKTKESWYSSLFGKQSGSMAGESPRGEKNQKLRKHITHEKERSKVSVHKVSSVCTEPPDFEAMKTDLSANINETFDNLLRVLEEKRKELLDDVDKHVEAAQKDFAFMRESADILKDEGWSSINAIDNAVYMDDDDVLDAVYRRAAEFNRCMDIWTKNVVRRGHNVFIEPNSLVQNGVEWLKLGHREKDSEILDMDIITRYLMPSLNEMSLKGNAWAKSKFEKWVVRRAESGDKEAQFQYGKSLFLGIGVEPQFVLAKEWLDRAKAGGYSGNDIDSMLDVLNTCAVDAEAGDPAAQFRLGGKYEVGDVVLKDEERAFKWFKKSADGNCPDGLVKIACYHMGGSNTTEDLTKAEHLLKMASEQNCPEAHYHLGMLYFSSNSIHQNFTQAKRCLENARAAGVQDARIGTMIDLCDRVAIGAENGDLEKQRILGEMYFIGERLKQNFTKASFWLQQYQESGATNAKVESYLRVCKNCGMRAEFGESDAQVELGNCYFRGDVVPMDKARAVQWYARAANKGNANAQAILGECYFRGMGVGQSFIKASKWLEEAHTNGFSNEKTDRMREFCLKHGIKAEEGDAEQQYIASQRMFEDTMTENDDKMRVSWLKKSASQGNKDAQFALGQAFQNAVGMLENPIQATENFKLAAEQGHVDAMFTYGMRLVRGEGTDVEDKMGMIWVVKAAEAGNAEAQYYLGMCFFNGDKLAQDFGEASKWLKMAEEQGKKDAISAAMIVFSETVKACLLGDECAKYRLTRYTTWKADMDMKKYVSWLEKAAGHGVDCAMVKLGECHYYGRGTARDVQKARVQWERAANLNDATAKTYLKIHFN